MAPDKAGTTLSVTGSLHYGPLMEFPPQLQMHSQNLCLLKIIFVQLLYFLRFSQASVCIKNGGEMLSRQLSQKLNKSAILKNKKCSGLIFKDIY